MGHVNFSSTAVGEVRVSGYSSSGPVFCACSLSANATPVLFFPNMPPSASMARPPELVRTTWCPSLCFWLSPGSFVCLFGFILVFWSLFVRGFLSFMLARMFSHVLVVVVVVVVICGHLVVVDPAHEFVRWFFIWEGRERERCASDNM